MSEVFIQLTSSHEWCGVYCMHRFLFLSLGPPRLHSCERYATNSVEPVASNGAIKLHRMFLSGLCSLDQQFAHCWQFPSEAADMDSMLCLVHVSHGANVYIQRGPKNIYFYIAVRTHVLGTTIKLIRQFFFLNRINGLWEPYASHEPQFDHM
jgi:hypothetical protein